MLRSHRRIGALFAGALAAVAVAASPAVASADTGHVIPVRQSPAGGYGANPDTYLAPVKGAFAVVRRGAGGITFIVHDRHVVNGDPYMVAIFNTPAGCVPASTPGKHVFDPDLDQVSLCDLIPADLAHSGFAHTGGTVSLLGEGNFLISVPVGPATGLTNPGGAEVAVFFPRTREIFITSPYLPGESNDDDQGSDD